ncbi:MAG: LPS export ABC transporter permease LptG [Sphingomonadales bacterium]|nr:LPS export ABC transporter permease LptG [Sphingomonadales bacterium]
MHFEFFPSRTLTLYLAKLFVTRILAVLVMLVLVLQLLDLLGESGKILAHPGNGEAQLWTYVSLRAPQLVATFLPYSVLLATIITFATLNQNSEVIAMRAGGLSAHQILAPLLMTAAAISLVNFAFNERVVTRSTATLKAWQAADFGPIPREATGHANVFMADGTSILAADSAAGFGKAMQLAGVTWYERDARGVIVAQFRSPHASFAAPGWRLDDPVRFDARAIATSRPGPVIVGQGVKPEQIEMSTVDADSQGIFTLTRSMARLNAAGRRTSELDGKWWHKISGPLAALLMPLLGAVAAFGLARSGQLLIRAVIGMALGFTYFVVDNAALALGNFGGYPPLVAAWAPFLLFLFVGETVLIRTEE